MWTVYEGLGDDGHIKHECATAPKKITTRSREKDERERLLKDLRHALHKKQIRLCGIVVHVGRREYRQDIEEITEESKNKKVHRQSLERNWLWKRFALRDNHTSTDFLTNFWNHHDELSSTTWGIKTRTFFHICGSLDVK
jgi:hypothetical protein